MAKMGLQFEAWQDYISKLDKIGGKTAIKRGVIAGLTSSKKYVNPQIEKGISRGSLPAGGKYSAPPHVKNALNTDMGVDWQGDTAEIKIGFDLKKKGGFTSIYLMHGTPKMKPAKGLKSAVYGSKTKREVGKIQEESISKVIKRIMEG